jgi:hypothetical protein
MTVLVAVATDCVRPRDDGRVDVDAQCDSAWVRVSDADGPV